LQVSAAQRSSLGRPVPLLPLLPLYLLVASQQFSTCCSVCLAVRAASVLVLELARMKPGWQCSKEQAQVEEEEEEQQQHQQRRQRRGLKRVREGEEVDLPALPVQHIQSIQAVNPVYTALHTHTRTYARVCTCTSTKDTRAAHVRGGGLCGPGGKIPCGVDLLRDGKRRRSCAPHERAHSLV
jgi:hypothetical protein